MSLLLLAPATAAADVRVVPPGGGAETIDAAGGVPLPDVLESAGVAAADFDFLDVLADGSAELRLSSTQAFARDDPAVLTETDTETTLTYDERIITGSRLVLKALDLEAGDGGSLSIAASASPTRVEVGEEVTFTATVGGSDDGEAVVRWTFQDGERGEGVEVAHRFERKGSYTVVAGVTTREDRAGASDLVTVEVVEPEATPTPTPTPTTTATASPAPGFSENTGDSGGSDSAGGVAAPVATATATATAAPAPAFGRPVAGELIELELAAAAPAPPAAPPARAEEAGGGLELSGAAVGVLCLIGAALAGFKLDMRRARVRW